MRRVVAYRSAGYNHRKGNIAYIIIKVNYYIVCVRVVSSHNLSCTYHVKSKVSAFKGRDRQCMVVELKVPFCKEIFQDSFENKYAPLKRIIGLK